MNAGARAVLLKTTLAAKRKREVMAARRCDPTPPSDISDGIKGLHWTSIVTHAGVTNGWEPLEDLTSIQGPIIINKQALQAHL